MVGFVYSFGMDVLGLRGWTKTWVLDFQNERVLIYLSAFVMGALCFRLKVFEGKAKGRVLYHVVNVTVWIPATVYIMFLLYPWFKPGQYIVSKIGDRLIVWLSFHVSLLCLMYVMIETFRRYLNGTGRLRNELNRNSYYVYIIHVVVIGCIALIMLGSAIPSLLKYLILTVSAYVASNVIISLGRCVANPARRDWRDDV
jgi:hypothetical protein